MIWILGVIWISNSYLKECLVCYGVHRRHCRSTYCPTTAYTFADSIVCHSLHSWLAFFLGYRNSQNFPPQSESNMTSVTEYRLWKIKIKIRGETEVWFAENDITFKAYRSSQSTRKTLSLFLVCDEPNNEWQRLAMGSQWAQWQPIITCVRMAANQLRISCRHRQTDMNVWCHVWNIKIRIIIIYYYIVNIV